MRQLWFFIFAALTFGSPEALAQEFKKNFLVEGGILSGNARKKSIQDNIRFFLASLPSESEWKSILSDFGPVKGNYCSPENFDETYQSACLSQLDCICKEHAFGYSLKRYGQENRDLLEKIFGVSFTEKQKNALYNTFLREMVLVWFAGQISGENLSEAILEAHAFYKKNPTIAKAHLEKLVIVNKVFNNKIESIKEEKKKFAESQISVLVDNSRTMAVTTQPIALLFGIFSVGYEWKFSKRATLHSRISFLSSSLITETYLGYRNKKDFSIFAGISSKFYVLGEALKYGIYMEPVVDLGYESVVNLRATAADDIRAVSVVPALMVGIDKIFNSGIQLGVGLGIGGHLAVWVYPESALTRSEQHFFVPKFYGTVGYSW
jgi:hypothetical protein